jgi:hypothetical protein
MPEIPAERKSFLMFFFASFTSTTPAPVCAPKVAGTEPTLPVAAQPRHRESIVGVKKNGSPSLLAGGTMSDPFL